MHAIMEAKSRDVRSGESTLLTQKLLDRRVYHRVSGQRVVPLEGLATLLADKRRFIGMLGQVFFPSFARGESQVAKGAKIGFFHVRRVFGYVHFRVFL